HGPIRPAPNTGLARIARTKQVVHIPNLKADSAYSEREPLRVVTVEHAGARSLVAVLMLKENKLIGAIVIYRQELRPLLTNRVVRPSHHALIDHLRRDRDHALARPAEAQIAFRIARAKLDGLQGLALRAEREPAFSV